VEDLFDQFDRVRSLAEGENLFLQGVIDLYQTRTATELNLFAKQLTSIGAILVTATLVAGIYGMNFEHMPELGWKYGYLFALALMAAMSLVLALVFRRRRWL
jgi:magnesium transporter